MSKTSQKPVKWKRALGGYVAPSPCGRTIVVWKMFGKWQVAFDGGYRVLGGFRTLAEAKRAAFNSEVLAGCREGLAKRRADERAKVIAERRKRAAEVIRDCRLADSAKPPAGLPWYEWAERRVGCTVEDVKQENENAAKEAFEGLLDEFGPKAFLFVEDWLAEYDDEE